jgi:hypothetical protein
MRSTITVRGQTVIPSEIRRRFRLTPAYRLEWVHESPELLMKAAEIKAKHHVSPPMPGLPPPPYWRGPLCCIKNSEDHRTIGCAERREAHRSRLMRFVPQHILRGLGVLKIARVSGNDGLGITGYDQFDDMIVSLVAYEQSSSNCIYSRSRIAGKSACNFLRNASIASPLRASRGRLTGMSQITDAGEGSGKTSRSASSTASRRSWVTTGRHGALPPVKGDRPFCCAIMLEDCGGAVRTIRRSRYAQGTLSATNL